MWMTLFSNTYNHYFNLFSKAVIPQSLRLTNLTEAIKDARCFDLYLTINDNKFNTKNNDKRIDVDFDVINVSFSVSVTSITFYGICIYLAG